MENLRGGGFEGPRVAERDQQKAPNSLQSKSNAANFMM